MINDTVIIRWHKKYNCYYLTCGNETFYDDERYLNVWDDKEEAIEWSRKNLGCTPDQDLKGEQIKLL